MGLALTAAPSMAQDFDEFDEEFEEETRTPPPPTRVEEDEFTDTFADDTAPAEGSERAVTDDEVPGEEASSERPREGLATDARGDLLNENGSDAWRARRFVVHNTWEGSTGGLHVVDAGSGPSQTFRVQLLTDFFFQNGFLNVGDDNSHIGGSLSLSYTPWDFLEIYAPSPATRTRTSPRFPRSFRCSGTRSSA
jgi:hypothetical protein